MQRAAQELTGGDRGVPHFAEEVLHDPALATLLRQAHRALEEPDAVLAGESCLLEALASLVARHAVDKVAAHRTGSAVGSCPRIVSEKQAIRQGPRT
jgi:hypothetical protein